MNKEAIINELATLRTTARVMEETGRAMAERATKLERLLTEEVSTSSKSRPQFQRKLAVVLANREKRYVKK